MHRNVHSSIICNSQGMEAMYVSINSRMDKDGIYVCLYLYLHLYVILYLYNEILLTHKKDYNFDICHNMDGPEGYYG